MSTSHMFYIIYRYMSQGRNGAKYSCMRPETHIKNSKAAKRESISFIFTKYTRKLEYQVPIVNVCGAFRYTGNSIRVYRQIHPV